VSNSISPSALVAIPTISRADLLSRNKAFLEWVHPPDRVLILDNGSQSIDLKVPVERSVKNLGVSGSWNLFLRRAFVEGNFKMLVILQDDIIWNADRLHAAKRLVLQRRNVDLFLSDLQFSVQVHRRGNETSIGFYDEQYYPGYCEDDDYALTMISKGKVYERFPSLNPLPGSITGGSKAIIEQLSSWEKQHQKLIAKWGRSFGVNIPGKPWYQTNRGFKF
jgi:GT2 family glycosyltransferase